MFQTTAAKEVADAIQWSAMTLRERLRDAFAASIVGVSSEVACFRNLRREIANQLNGLRIPAVAFSCRTAETHQKPRVRVSAPRSFECELADLLVVVKYRRGNTVVHRSSILYQAKMCRAQSFDCHIDRNQLELLCEWPRFEFGLKANGGSQIYFIQPKTLEFGSYFITLRAPGLNQYIPCRQDYCYWGSQSVAPHALAVRRRGPVSVAVDEFPNALNGTEAFFAHIAGERGELHAWNPAIEELVAALYRHVGLAPDPPGEFDGFWQQANRDEAPFVIIEITAESGDEKRG